MKCSQDRTFWSYYCSLSKVKLLSPDEERDLLRRYYKENDLEARNKIVESCLRFIVKLAIKYAHNMEELKELISAGNEGLLVAFSKFDLNRKVRFLSYAAYWALLHIRNEQYKNLVVAPPPWYQKMVTRINKIHAQTLTRHHRLATAREISKSLKITEAQAKKIEQLQFVDLSPTVPADNTAIDRKEHLEHVKQMLQRLLDTKQVPLSKREAFILRAYYGLIDEKHWTLKQISNYLQMSSERVRQLKRHALETLREFSKIQRLSTM